MTEDEAFELVDNLLQEFSEREKARNLMKSLDIPHDGDYVNIMVLKDIFTDPQKCQQLISKLKLKAFW